MFAVRPGRSTDLGFVVNSWLKSFNEHIHAAERRAGYWDAHKRVICDGLLPRSRLLIAHGPDDDDIIYGWACGQPGEPTLLHYAYTKKVYRGAGIARALLDTIVRDGGAGVCVTATATQAAYCPLHVRRKHWSVATRIPFYLALGKVAA
jgi:GNAT superfamily N-acetyltransferase